MSKLLDEAKNYRKDMLFDDYTRVVYENFKEYEKITKKKMLEEMIKVYEEPDNIIEICTLKELKYLKKVLSKDRDLLDKKYNFERRELLSKRIIIPTFENEVEYQVPDEIKESIKKALTKYDPKEKEEIDKKNILIAGFVKTLVVTNFEPVYIFASMILNKTKKETINYILNNRMLRYYIYFEEDPDDILRLVYNEYYEYSDEVMESKKNNNIIAFGNLDEKTLTNIFYYDYDLDNPNIKKFADYASKKYSSYDFNIKKVLLQGSLLNLSKKEVEDLIKSIPIYKNEDLTELFKLLGPCLDEMPSAALNGLTPKEARKYQKEAKDLKNKITQKQTNAHLTKEDADLFYKLYFGLLDYTNQKLKIRNMKIYKQLYLNPNSLKEVIEKLYENLNIIDNFIKDNPYNFSKEELNIVKDFKKEKRGIFTIFKFEKEYTVFMDEKHVYMVKGVRANIDEIVKDLPQPVITTLIPFKNKIIYDGILLNAQISIGPGIIKLLNGQYNKCKKIYKL